MMLTALIAVNQDIIRVFVSNSGIHQTVTVVQVTMKGKSIQYLTPIMSRSQQLP
jgi:hypothetical protein